VAGEWQPGVIFQKRRATSSSYNGQVLSNQFTVQSIYGNSHAPSETLITHSFTKKMVGVEVKVVSDNL